MLVEGCDTTEEQADEDTIDFPVSEGSFENPDVQHERETDTSVTHDADCRWISSLINPRAEVLAKVVKNAKAEDEAPNLPRCLLEGYNEGLVLQGDADAACHGRGQRIVPLNHNDRKTFKTARCHKRQGLSKHADYRE